MSRGFLSDWNLQRLSVPIEVEGTTIYRPYPSGDLLVCVDDNEGSSHASLKDLQLYERQRRLISCEALVGSMIEILYNESEWRLALVLSYNCTNGTHMIQFILRNAPVTVSNPPDIGTASFHKDDGKGEPQHSQQQWQNRSSSSIPNTHVTTLSDLNLNSIPAHHYSKRKATVNLRTETFYVKMPSALEAKRLQGLNEWKERRLQYSHWNEEIPSQFTLEQPPFPSVQYASSSVLFKDLSSTSTYCDAAYYLSASMVHFAYCPSSAEDTLLPGSVIGDAKTNSNTSGSNNSNDTDINHHCSSNITDSSGGNTNGGNYVDQVGNKRGSLEQGHQLRGHRILRPADCNIAYKCKSSLLYGEFTPRGLNKALDEDHLKAHQSCRVMYDMGMGVGKAAMQAFLQCTNMEKVVGIELSSGRYSIAAEAALQLCKQHPLYFKVRHYNPGSRCVITATEEYETLLRSLPRDSAPSSSSSSSSSSSNVSSKNVLRTHPRVYELRCQDMFAFAGELKDVDVLLLMTDITKDKRKECMRMLYSLPIGARVLTYDEFPEITEKPSKIFGSGWLSNFTSGGLMNSWRSLGRLLSSRQHRQRISGSNNNSGNKEDANMNTPFIHLGINQPVCDRFSSTWSLNRGHHLFIYQRSLSPATAMSDVTNRLRMPQRQDMNNDIFNHEDTNICNMNDNSENKYNGNNDYGSDEKCGNDVEVENISDLSHENRTTGVADQSSSLSSTATAVKYLGSQYNSDRKSGHNAVGKRPQHTQSMFLSLLRLFPGNLLSFKSSPGNDGGNRFTPQ